MALLDIRDITKSFGSHKVFAGLKLQVEEHQVVCLIGPSGCGKSTLLRCINGLEGIDGGEIRLHGDRVTGPGVDVNALRRDVGIVFQAFNLSSVTTVAFLFVLITIPQARFVDRLMERDQRRMRAAG